MTTLLATLLFAGAAQAQDVVDDATVYDLNCTDTQVNMAVVVRPVGDRGPDTILYRDGHIEETHCNAQFGEARQNYVHDQLLDECLLSGLGDDLCQDLTADIMDQMVFMAQTPPIDGMSYSPRAFDDEGGARAGVLVSYDGKESEPYRVFSRDGDFRSPRFVMPPRDADTRLACMEAGRVWAHGLAGDARGRLEVADAAAWRCTDDAGELDISVRFRFKNRAVGSPVLPQ